MSKSLLSLFGNVWRGVSCHISSKKESNSSAEGSVPCREAESALGATGRQITAVENMGKENASSSHYVSSIYRVSIVNVSYKLRKSLGLCDLQALTFLPSLQRLASVLVIAFFVGIGSVWGETWSWTASSGDLGTSTSTTVTLNGKSWSVTRSSVVYTGWSSNCIQLGSGSGAEVVTLSTSAISGIISKVSVECASYNGAHKIAISVGETSYLSSTATPSWTTVNTKEGTGSSSGTVQISFTGGSRALYIKSITIQYSASTYNVDWYVGGTRTKQETGVTSGTPPSVADGALGGSCSSLKFLGWSETNIGSTPNDAPADLFSSDDVPSLTENKTFYAVFGEVSYDTDGTPVKTQTHQYDTWTYSGTTADKTDYRLFGNNAYVQTDAFDLSGLTKVIVYGGTYGGNSYNGISIKDASGNVWKTGTVSGNSQTGTNNFTDGVSLTGTKALRVYSTSGDGSSTGVRISKVEVYTYPLEYSNCVTSCAACTADPTVGAASLKGSFSLSSVGVTATGWAAGTNCSWEDYGFVWGTSANPTIGASGCTQVQVGTSGSATTWDGALSTGSFTVGTTYHFRAYGKNGKADATYQYSDDATFTPRSVTFNLKGHGSNTPSMQYVNDGGKASDPSYSEVVDHWSFEGWYSNSDCTGSVWDFSTNTVSGGDVTLYAKWVEASQYIVNWYVNGSIAHSQTGYEGTTLTSIPTPTSSDCDGSKVFVGWYTSTYSHASAAPAYVSPTTIPNGGADYYAVFADEGEGGAGYSKLDWGGTVTAGQYLLSTGTYTITGPDGNKTSQLAAATFTPPASAAASSYEVTIALIGNYFTIQLAEGRYIGWSSKTSTNLTKDAPTSETDAYLWKYTANGIQNKAAETRYLQINAAGTNGKVYTTEAEGTNWLRTYLYSTGSVSYSDYATTCSTDPRISASPSSSWAFGEVNVGSNSSKTFTIRGANLTEGITATLSGTNAGMFSISSSSIAHPGCNGSNDIVVTYSPTASGSHSATLTLSSTGATNKVITLTGTGVVTCTTPELSFASALVTKYADAANFTNPLTVKGNERNAAVTYSSSDASKASVNATTGEVDVKAVTADGTPVVITATIAAAADNGTSCQNTTSASYNLVVAHKITWYVNGSEYTEGSPTIAVADGGSIDVLPDAPDGTATCGNKVFVGWTENSSYSNASTPPGDLFLDPSGAPTPITTDKNFYAVFATSPTANSYYKANLSRLTDGQTVIIVNHSTSKALSHNKSAADVSISGSVLTTSNTDLLWTVEIDEDNDDSYFFKVGTNYLIGLDANPWLKVDDEDVDSWTIQEDTYYYLYANAPVPGAYRYLEYYNNNFTTYGYNSDNDNQYAMDFYIPNYTNYAITCTTPFVVTATSAGHGTVEVSNTYVASGGSTTLTLTPAAGYGCESVTLRSGTATVGTLTGCECTITSITSDIEVNVAFAKLPVYSVTFDAGTGRISGGSATTTISETTRGSGVMAPTAITCAEDWTFAYWSTTDVETSTTTVPAHTADAGERYVPAANNMTLYAVYTHTTGTPVYTYGTDNITVSTTGVTENKYTYWSGKSVTTGAVYAGNSAKNYSVMALRDKDPSAIVSTTSGGTLNQVTITWDSHTAANRSVRVYGYNTAYEEPTDVYGTNGTQIKGKLLGSLTYDGSMATNTLDVTGSYTYVGIRAKDGATYISNIAIKWITAVSGLTTNYWSRPECDDCTEATFGFEKSAVTLTYPYAGTYTNTFTTNNTNAKSFTSSTPAVATVNGSTGAVTIVGLGTTTISVHQNRMTSGAKYCATDDSYELTVREASVDVVEVNNNNDIIVEHEFGGNANALIDQLVLHEEGNVAEEVFVSKYFEASGSVKLVALYNGTGKDADPSKYRIRSVGGSKTQHIVKVGDYVEEWPTGKELIFYSWDTGNSNDLDVMECVNEMNDNGEIRLSDWIAVPWSTYYPTKPGIIFGGEEAVVLEEYDGENWNILDIVGALKADGKTADHTNITSNGSISWGDHNAWYCTNGRELGGDEDADFALATVRCLLVRKFDVTSGKASRNTTTGNLGTGNFNTLCTEWYGKHVSKNDETQSTCDAFTEVGKFDYYNAYTKYEELNTDAFSATNNSDGTMTIHIDPDKVEGGLAGLSCNFLKIKITSENQSETLANVEYRVPIIVADNKNTNDAIFTKFEDCSFCDVVILKDYTLTTDESGKNELHDVEVYPGAKLTVQSEQTLDVNQLILRSKGDDVPLTNIQGTLNRTKSDILFDKRIDGLRWYFFTLPYDCAVADIMFRDGATAEHGVDFLIQYYDGEERASQATAYTTNSPHWKQFTGETLKAGVGYIVAVEPKTGHNYSELRFPMKNASLAVETVNVPVHAWGGDKTDEQLNPSHKGWNLIGNPFLNTYNNSRIEEPVKVGVIEYSGTDWVLNTTENVRYLYKPYEGGQSYYEPISIANEELLPFTGYFVQIGGNNPSEELNVSFARSNVKTSMPHRLLMTDVDDSPVWVGVELTNSRQETDVTTLLVSDRFTDGYDMMDDLAKWRGTYYQYAQVTTRPVLASRNTEGEMAFNALPDATAKAGVGLNYFAAEKGQYTLSLSHKYPLSNLDEVWLYDAAEQHWHDLLLSDYNFTSARTDDKSRFTLTVRVKRSPKVTTAEEDLDNYGDVRIVTGDKRLAVLGLQQGSEVWVYDAAGRLIIAREKVQQSERLVVDVPASGVYNVRVQTADGAQTLKAVVK